MTTTDFDKIIWRDALTFVDFFATWCGPCQMMHPAIDKFQREMNGRVDVYKVDIDDRGMLDAVHRYNSCRCRRSCSSAAAKCCGARAAAWVTTIW